MRGQYKKKPSGEGQNETCWQEWAGGLIPGAWEPLDLGDNLDAVARESRATERKSSHVLGRWEVTLRARWYSRRNGNTVAAQPKKKRVPLSCWGLRAGQTAVVLPLARTIIETARRLNNARPPESCFLPRANSVRIDDACWFRVTVFHDRIQESRNRSESFSAAIRSQFHVGISATLTRIIRLACPIRSFKMIYTRKMKMYNHSPRLW
jgi:hypothetical protein